MPDVRNRNNQATRAIDTKVADIKNLNTFNNLNSFFGEYDYSKETIQNLVREYNQLEIGYVKKIETYCWFYNTGEIAGHDDTQSNYEYFRYKMNTGKDAHYYRCEMAKINVDKLSISPEKLTNLYNELLEYSRGYSTKQLDLFSDIRADLKVFLGDVKLSKTKNRKDSYVDYNDLSIAKEKIKALYNEIDKFSTSGLKKNITDKASDVKFRVNTDIESVGDTSYGYDLVDTEQKKLAKGAVDFAVTYNTKWAEFIIPSTSQMITYIQSKFPKIKFEGKKLIYGIDNIFGDKGIINSLGKKVDGLKENLHSLKKKINGICEAYNKLENSAKNKFEGNKTHKKYSKTEIAVKYSGLVDKLKDAGYTKKQASKYAKKYLSKILKKTNSKVTSAEVLSIYKKYKNKKKISGNLNSKEEKDTKRTKKTTARKTSSKRSSGATAAMAATGATVAATKVKKATKKATKTNSKKIKSSVKNGVLTTVPSLASLKAMKKQLQNNTTVKISNIKTEANNRIADIEGKAEDEKKLAEIEKNNTIKQINEEAASKINAIDPNDSEASTKIENIQTEAENAIKNADEKYENRVNEIEAKKNQDVSQVENSRENDIKSVEEKSNKELKEINDDIEKAKKTKSSKKSVQTMAKTSSKATETKAETKEYKSNVSDNDVETSGTAADDSSTKVDEAVSNKQDEITAAEQAKENTSSSDSSANVAQPETTTSTPEQSTSTSVETDTSSNNTNYSTSGASTSSNYNNSYDADESYSAGDYNTIEQQKQADINSSNTGVDQSTLKSDSTTKSTFNIKKDTTSSTSSSTSSNKDIDDISSISSTKSTSSKKSSGLGAAVPIGLGIAATGAAAVAGVRYVKNKKLNEDYDENYDDENNDVYNDEVPSDSAYMADDYLGPEGSSYTEVPDDNEYTDAEALEEEAGVSDFSEDAALNELN